MELTSLERKYNVIKTLHVNEQTVVNEVTEKSGGGKFVSKRVSKTFGRECNKLKLHWETTLLKQIDHRNIIKLHDWDENEYYVFMIFEKMDEDLFSFVARINLVPESKAVPIITQILEGVQFLHAQNILHRDLKVDNILCDNLKDGMVRIAISDFGFAIRTDSPIVEPLGTPFYAAPEVFHSAYGKSIDAWAIGIISYTMLTGHFPFYAEDHDLLVRQIFNNSVVWPKSLKISDNAKDFVEVLLRKQPEKRISVDQALGHPFITG